MSITLSQHRLLIEPIYPAPKYHGIWFSPHDDYTHEPSMGIVVATGKNTPFKIGTTVCFRQHESWPVHLDGKDLRYLYDVQVVATVRNRELYPTRGKVLILPDWSRRKSSVLSSNIIYLEKTVGDYSIDTPCNFGQVVRVGEQVTEAVEGQNVIFTNTGHDIGFMDTVYYILRQEELLATYE